MIHDNNNEDPTNVYFEVVNEEPTTQIIEEEWPEKTLNVCRMLWCSPPHMHANASKSKLIPILFPSYGKLGCH